MTEFSGFAIAIETNAGRPVGADMLDASCALRLREVSNHMGQPRRRLQLAEIVCPGMSTEERLRRETGDVFIADSRLARFVHEAIQEKIENDSQPAFNDFSVMYTIVKTDGAEVSLTMACLMLATSNPFSFDILLQSPDKSKETEGIRTFNSLCEAFGIAAIDDSGILHGRVANLHWEKDAYTRRRVRRFIPARSEFTRSVGRSAVAGGVN